MFEARISNYGLAVNDHKKINNMVAYFVLIGVSDTQGRPRQCLPRVGNRIEVSLGQGNFDSLRESGSHQLAPKSRGAGDL